MFPDLLWIVGIYAAAAAVAHGVLGGRSGGSGSRHYVLVAGNHQLQIEWYLRALRRHSRRTGTDIGITVVLEDSTDETGPILEKFSREEDGIALIRSEGTSDAAAGSDPRERAEWHCKTANAASGDPGRQVVWIDLKKREDVSRLPL
ncbi:hypothetical protein [Cohnella caldifontis]|uniref:hypothetical protein n=1 Tax=Cohnella caldifontis TaxID=3027471 RepID=UPI0023EE139E|nr:hypothetical protein [Cohnella sp. YIM B05605]